MTDFAVSLAADGIVLLKNEGDVLPLKRGERAVLLGFTSYFPHRMGWGSGDMPLKTPVPYDEGLEKAGIALEPKVAAFYRKTREKRLRRQVYARLNRDWGKWTARFKEPFLWRWRLKKALKDVPRSVKCIVTIGRNAGETVDMKDRPGSFRLSLEERKLLAFACSRFDDVIVLLNTAGVIDTSFMDLFPVKALLFTSLLGEVSGTAAAKILTGEITPSGRTVDTWAKSYCDWPGAKGFGGREVDYTEGGKVGYRGIDPAKVRYPFGFGLSYTTFSEERDGDGVKVVNTGERKGSHVVMEWKGGELAGFAKTKILLPGESERVVFSRELPHARPIPVDLAEEESFAGKLTDGELVKLVNGVTEVDSPHAGEVWAARGEKNLKLADGPSGVRLARFGAKDGEVSAIAREMFAWPCATAIAQGWSERSAEKFGRMIAADLSRAGIGGWLGPAVNLHRNPLCGRNFEYFSEDPLLAGKMGAAVIRGVQTLEGGSPSGRFATLKHLCANNQESFRDVGSSNLGKDALAVYLRPFAIAVREGRPKAVMTAYNRLNGEPCATSAWLLNGVLRGEWGFCGAVMTDWWTVSEKWRHPGSGNDLAMPGVEDDRRGMASALADGRLKRADLVRSAARILALSGN